jgi:uncharacterized protein YjcR
MERKIHLYSDAFEKFEKVSSYKKYQFYEEICDILQSTIEKSCIDDLVVEVQDLPLLIAGMEGRLRVLLKNRPAPTREFREDERYYEKKILGQNIIFESDYDRTMGAMEAWMFLANKAYKNHKDIHFLFSESEPADGSILALIRNEKELPRTQLWKKLPDRYADESKDQIIARISRLAASGLVKERTQGQEILYSITKKGEMVAL